MILLDAASVALGAGVGGAARQAVTNACARAFGQALPWGTIAVNVSGSFLSGEHAMRAPEVDDAHANPVLMYFLEYEVRQLQRATKGGAAHFRQRIRLSLVDQAELTPTQIQWAGHDVAATLVRVSPFLDDPYRARFERESHKVYSFVMSDAVPGGIYQIRSVLPASATGAGTAAVEETLTLVPR